MERSAADGEEGASKHLKQWLHRVARGRMLPSPVGAAGGPKIGKTGHFCLLINHASGVRVPASIEHEFTDYTLECRVSVSFFDSCTRNFFGRTWASPSACGLFARRQSW